MRHTDDRPTGDVGSFRSDSAVTSHDVGRMSDAELLSLYEGLSARFGVVLMQGDSLDRRPVSHSLMSGPCVGLRFARVCTPEYPHQPGDHRVGRYV
jgi:hypothetical protein